MINYFYHFDVLFKMLKNTDKLSGHGSEREPVEPYIIYQNWEHIMPIELQFQFLKIPLKHVNSLKNFHELSLFAKEQIQNLMCEKKKTMAIDNGKEMRI